MASSPVCGARFDDRFPLTSVQQERQDGRGEEQDDVDDAKCKRRLQQVARLVCANREGRVIDARE